MTTNTYCIMCAECFRTCPHDNVAFNLRPFAADLADTPKPRKDEAYLALILFALTAFHGLTMTPTWKRIVHTLQIELSVSQIAAFSIGMAICLLLPVLIYALCVRVSGFLAGEGLQKVGHLFVKYAYALIPIALFYHIAHNIEHFFMESQKLVALVSDPFGYGWNLFDTAAWQPEPLLSLQTVWYLQAGLVIVGHVFGILIAHQHASRIFKTRRAAMKSQIPMIGLMVLFSVFSLWLIAQPMEMRSGM
ncbi:MAG: hypothetical protein ACE5IY_02815 [bacterium]